MNGPRLSRLLGIPADPVLPGMAPGALLASVHTAAGWGPPRPITDANVEAVAWADAGDAVPTDAGAMVLIHDGDTGEPVAVLGVVL